VLAAATKTVTLAVATIGIDVLGTAAGVEVEVSGPAVGVSIRTVPAPPSEIGGLYMVTVTEPDPPA
jgi:hypothetical protein